MLEKLQKFGAAMFVPVLLFPFVGIVLSLIIILQNPQFVGSLADSKGLFFKILKIFEEGAWTVFRQMPLLFALGLPISLAKKAHSRAVLTTLVSYLTFNYYISAILSFYSESFGIDFSANVGGTSGLAMIAGIKTLDTNIIGAIFISAVTVYIHNRYFDTKLPDFLGIFQGTTFVTILTFFLMLPLAFLTVYIWPIFQQGILLMQSFMIKSGALGVWLYTFLERVLIPTGLHHFIYNPFVFGPAVVEGGISHYWINHLQEFSNVKTSLKELFPQGGFALHGNAKVFGLPGIAMAMYVTARRENKKLLLGLLISASLTSVLAGITEPLEFTFLFVAPLLFVVHSFLAATLASILYSFGVVGNMGGGLLEIAASVWIPLFKHHSLMVFTNISIGLIFTIIYFYVFKTLILKFDVQTPGRAIDEETKLYSKSDYKNKKVKDFKPQFSYKEKAINFLNHCGGRENIISLTNCATRLRIVLAEREKVAGLNEFKKSGAYGLLQKGKALQIIVGLDAPNIKEEFEKLL